MPEKISYNYSPEALIIQFQLIKSQLHYDFSKLNTHCLLIIDAALLRRRNNEPSLLTELKKREVIKVPVAPKYLTNEFSPWLIPLNLSLEEDAKIFNESINLALQEIDPEYIRQGKGRLISGWFASHDSPQATALHLGKSAIQAQKNKDVLLRYYDPAVAMLLCTVLDNWQKQRLLGPVIRWSSVDGDGQLSTRTGMEQQSFRLSHSISLSPDNWRDIELITITNFVLREYRLANINSARQSETQVFQTILPALRRAAEYRFQNRDDLIAFATHALTVSPEFDRHPEISRRLAFRDANQKISYREAIATVTETHWENIRTGGQ